MGMGEENKKEGFIATLLFFKLINLFIIIGG